MSNLSRTALAAIALPALLSAQDAKRVPSVDDLLNIRSASSPQLSPDGRRVAFLVSQADWTADAFVTQVYVAQTDGGDPVQLTRGEKPATQIHWSPDGQWIAFTSMPVGDKAQIFGIRRDGGEAVQLTKAENGVQSYEWSRDGRSIAFTAMKPSPALKERKATF